LRTCAVLPWSNIELIGFFWTTILSKGSQFSRGLPRAWTLDQIAGIAAQYSITDAVIALPMGAMTAWSNVCHPRRVVDPHSRHPRICSPCLPNASLEGFGGIPAIRPGQPGITGWSVFGSDFRSGGGHSGVGVIFASFGGNCLV